MTIKETDKEKVYAYIDNFNFYHGIEKEEYNDVKWLDWQEFIKLVVSEVFSLREEKNEYSIEKIKYFTSEVKPRMGWEKSNRQKTYWDAIEYNKDKDPNVEIIYGRFAGTGNKRYAETEKNGKIKLFTLESQRKKGKRPKFHRYKNPKFKLLNVEKIGEKGYDEKKTDVNIACHIVGDAYENKYDTALLVSADSDFTPALEWIKEKSKKKIIIAFPLNVGKSSDMEKIADKNERIDIEKKHLEKCRFPEIIKAENGEIIAECPETWKWQTENNE